MKLAYLLEEIRRWDQGQMPIRMETLMEVTRRVANPNAIVTRDWLARLANGATIAVEGRVHLDRKFLAAQADLLHAIVKELPEGDIALVALNGDDEEAR